jgi:hypothetical protein
MRTTENHIEQPHTPSPRRGSSMGEPPELGPETRFVPQRTQTQPHCLDSKKRKKVSQLSAFALCQSRNGKFMTRQPVNRRVSCADRADAEFSSSYKRL